ncbi:hypothetical protein ACQEVZ_21105 [Dactylosporangium sp. CA-152071]|uniref:hypothetical protein n=1 Tax=Dactylosporangium sp. CA-152071 TaxID=3239933 RepID=UPI003D8A1CE5
MRPVKLYISAELQPVLHALCAPSLASASALWQESAVRGSSASAFPVPTVAFAPAAAPIASFAVTGGVAALGGVLVPGGVEVQGSRVSATGLGGVKVQGVSVLGREAGRGTTGTTSTIERDRTVEQMPAVGVQLLDRRGVQVQGTSGLTANDKHDLTAPKPNGGVRGTPPRGRPA